MKLTQSLLISDHDQMNMFRLFREKVLRVYLNDRPASLHRRAGSSGAQFRAVRLYRRLGWNFCGVIPGCALNPDRTSCDTTVYWKSLT